MLFIVIWLPGAGKSTLSKLIQKKYNATILNTDEFRKFIFNINPREKDNIYPEAIQDMSYKAMFIATKYLLKNKINVIIDAALYSNKLVKEAKKLSNKSKVIQVICPEKLVKERLQRRVKKSGQKYSAWIKVYEYMKAKTEIITGIDVVFDTSKNITIKNITKNIFTH